jgi:hypothetical protein
MKKNFFKTRYAAIILIAAGYGWAGDHYILANSSVLAYLFQFITIIALVITGISSLSISENEKHTSNWAVTGLGIFSALLLLINILNIIHDAVSSRIHSFGFHNSLADLVPVALLVTGNVLWVISIVRSIKHDTNANLFKSQYNIL